MTNKKVLSEGWHVGSQTPIDDRLVFADLAALQNMGTADVNAYRYYEGMLAYVISENKSYRWLESATGALTTGITYPANIVVNGTTYSNKTFNFVSTVVTVPDNTVSFSTDSPTDVGVVFTPNTPATTNTLYFSATNSSSWTWDGSDYQTYSAPAPATEWYILGTTIDAAGNKINAISRTGSITVSADSYFNTIRVGKGSGAIATNTVIGFESFNSNINGAQSTSTGYQSLRTNTVGGNNSSYGFRSLYQNDSGSDNSSFGTYSLSSATIANSNSVFGRSGLTNATTGGYNSGLGMEVLYGLITGANNTGLGYRAGGFLGDGITQNTTPQNSVFLGYGTKSLTNNDTNQTVIGYNAIGKGSNTVQIGNTSVTDTYIQGILHINGAWVLPTTAPTTGQVLGYLGAGTTTWVTPSAGGIWGIPNASGIYTYYATWALAVAAASSGQCIELFADVVESSTSYTLKSGVNINGNGHSIAFSLVDGFVATSAPTICEINNLTVNQLTSGLSGLYINAVGSIVGGNSIFNSNNSGSYGIYGRLVTKIYGFTCTGYNPINTSNFFSPNAIIDNVYVNSTLGSITTGTLSNSTIYSTSTSLPAVGLCSTVNNCYIYGNGYSPIEATSAMEVNNCTIISTVSRAINGTGPFTFNNCWIKSSANSINGNGIFNNCTLITPTTSINVYLGGGSYNNCTITASASAVFSSFGAGYINNCNVICGYNNVVGYAFSNSACYVNNSIIQLANSGATAFYGGSAITMYLANNSIKGSANFKNANVTNGQTNTADAQGNVILN